MTADTRTITEAQLAAAISANPRQMTAKKLAAAIFAALPDTGLELTTVVNPLDVERLDPAVAAWMAFLDSWDNATIHDWLSLDSAIRAARARLTEGES